MTCKHVNWYFVHTAKDVLDVFLGFSGFPLDGALALHVSVPGSTESAGTC